MLSVKYIYIVKYIFLYNASGVYFGVYFFSQQGMNFTDKTKVPYINLVVLEN